MEDNYIIFFLQMSEGLTHDLNKAIDNSPYLMQLPKEGWSTEKIIEEATQYTKFGEDLPCIYSTCNRGGVTIDLCEIYVAAN